MVALIGALHFDVNHKKVDFLRPRLPAAFVFVAAIGAKLLSKDEARRIAANIAKLPDC